MSISHTESVYWIIVSFFPSPCLFLSFRLENNGRGRGGGEGSSTRFTIFAKRREEESVENLEKGEEGSGSRYNKGWM